MRAFVCLHVSVAVHPDLWIRQIPEANNGALCLRQDYSLNCCQLNWHTHTHAHTRPSITANTQQAHFKNSFLMHNLDDSSVSAWSNWCLTQCFSNPPLSATNKYFVILTVGYRLYGYISKSGSKFCWQNDSGRLSALTEASLSKRANSSFSVMTSSWAVHWDARLVKPSMSANSMLQKRWRRRWQGRG